MIKFYDLNLDFTYKIIETVLLKTRDIIQIQKVVIEWKKYPKRQPHVEESLLNSVNSLWKNLCWNSLHIHASRALITSVIKHVVMQNGPNSRCTVDKLTFISSYRKHDSKTFSFWCQTS